MTTLGACIISRNDNYGGDLDQKLTYCLSSFINAMDEVYYIDWNSPGNPLIDEIRDRLPKTGKLKVIVIPPGMATHLVNYDKEVQNCVEVLARNIGLRRLNTDYMISTNSDIMCSDKQNILLGIEDKSTFHTVARRNMDFADISHYQSGSPELLAWIINNHHKYGQYGSGSPLGERDIWSLISCPGDFQLASREVWYGIRGFEASLVYRGYTDSNVQRKADYYGFKQALVRNIIAMHFNHYPGSGSTGGNSARWNTEDCLFNFNGTTNRDTWGFSDIDFEEEII
jgi:hypothetical protein